MDPNNDSNLLTYLKKRIKRINKDYEVVDMEADGCDMYGIKYWVSCKNGYSARSWDLDSKINQTKLDIYESISTNGFKFKKVTYYYDHDKLRLLVLKLK